MAETKYLGAIAGKGGGKEQCRYREATEAGDGCVNKEKAALERRLKCRSRKRDCMEVSLYQTFSMDFETRVRGVDMKKSKGVKINVSRNMMCKL